jgi:hypothetical protein
MTLLSHITHNDTPALATAFVVGMLAGLILALGARFLLWLRQTKD